MSELAIRNRLERGQVIEAALRLLDEVGLEGLSTRRLAGELGVRGPALYWHFRNKQALIDEMARAILADAFTPPAKEQSWTEWLTSSARRLRATLMSHRDGAKLLAGYRPRRALGRLLPGPGGACGDAEPGTVQAEDDAASPDADRRLEEVLQPLRRAGFNACEAIGCLRTVGLYTFGWAMDEQEAHGREPAAAGMYDPETGFEFGLSVIIDGLRSRVEMQALEGLELRRRA